MVISSGIYTDLGAKQLREMLFKETKITGLFCFENRKAVFEGVDSRYKFVVLTYEKGGQTQKFPAAFMRHDVEELERFPRVGALEMSVDLISLLSPDSLSVMEFKNETDVHLAHKMMKFPILGERLTGKWNVIFANEFHMTNDHHLFKIEPGPDRLPLYEGKMIHQFTNTLTGPRYWINEREGRAPILGRNLDTRQELEYQQYRLGYRSIARSTDARTMIATVLPPKVFYGHSINATQNRLKAQELLFLTSMLNSFVLDFSLRQRVSANLTMFYIYQLPVPRLTEQDTPFRMIVERTAKLICTTPDFQDLWETVMPSSMWSPNVVAIDQPERARLRAELDGLVAHVYELSEKEFHYILSTFPLVEQSIKDAALDAYREFALAPDDLALKELIDKGENAKVEFKEVVCWDARANRKDEGMRRNQVIQEVDAFLNSREGGVVLIGIEDNGTVVGLADDYRAANLSKPNRDSYQLYLLDNLKNNLIGNWSLFYNISFGTLQGKDVCRIDVAPANEPVYIKGGDFYIREGNRKRKLSSQETVAYIKKRWGSA